MRRTCKSSSVSISMMKSIGVLVVDDLMEGEFVLQVVMCILVFLLLHISVAAHQFPPAGGCGK